MISWSVHPITARYRFHKFQATVCPIPSTNVCRTSGRAQCPRVRFRCPSWRESVALPQTVTQPEAGTQARELTRKTSHNPEAEVTPLLVPDVRLCRAGLLRLNGFCRTCFLKPICQRPIRLVIVKSNSVSSFHRRRSTSYIAYIDSNTEQTAWKRS